MQRLALHDTASCPPLGSEAEYEKEVVRSQMKGKKLKGDESIYRCSFDTLPLHFLTSLSKLSAAISVGELLATWLRFSLQKCMLAARKIYPLTFSSHFLWKAQVSFSLTMKMCGGERRGEPHLFIKQLNGPIFILHTKLCT